jgi:hypothetical protein
MGKDALQKLWPRVNYTSAKQTELSNILALRKCSVMNCISNIWNTLYAEVTKMEIL